MLETYPATLQGDRIVWQDDQPHLSPTAETLVYVTLVTPVAPPKPVLKKPDGARMAAILEEIAASSTFAWPEDPVAWEREIRSEKSVWEELIEAGLIEPREDTEDAD